MPEVANYIGYDLGVGYYSRKSFLDDPFLFQKPTDFVIPEPGPYQCQINDLEKRIDDLENKNKLPAGLIIKPTNEQVKQFGGL